MVAVCHPPAGTAPTGRQGHIPLRAIADFTPARGWNEAINRVLALRAAPSQPLTAIAFDKWIWEGYPRVRLHHITEGMSTHFTV